MNNVKMCWISVTDRTPLPYEGYNEDTNSYSHCEYDSVLVKGGIPTKIGVAQWDSHNNKWSILGGLGCYSDLGFLEFDSDEITHWIYLDDVIENIEGEVVDE